MPQLFRTYANTIAHLALPCVLLGAGTTVWVLWTGTFSPYVTNVGIPISQPVPFSHKHHVAGLGIDCRYCHTGVETSPFAGIPPTETCMTCHSQIWRDAPVLAPVRESWATNRPLHWQRVYDLPDYVYFNHSIHIQKGIACISCHGRIDQMPLTAKAQTLYMRWCLDCHRDPAPHKRPINEVFEMRETSSETNTGMLREVQSGRTNSIPGKNEPALVRGAPGHGAHLEDCSVCHR